MWFGFVVWLFVCVLLCFGVVLNCCFGVCYAESLLYILAGVLFALLRFVLGWCVYGCYLVWIC